MQRDEGLEARIIGEVLSCRESAETPYAVRQDGNFYCSHRQRERDNLPRDMLTRMWCPYAQPLNPALEDQGVKPLCYKLSPPRPLLRNSDDEVSGASIVTLFAKMRITVV